MKFPTKEFLMGMGISLSFNTTIQAVKVTPEAAQIIADIERAESRSLKLHEKAKEVWKLYSEAGISWALALACFGGVMHECNKEIVMGATTAAYFEQMYKTYREKNIELYGHENDQAIKHEIAKDRITADKPRVIQTHNGELYHIYDEVTEQYFYATYKELEHAERELNRILDKECPVKYNHLLKMFKNADHKTKRGELLGWFLDDTFFDYHYWNESFFAHQYIELILDPVEIDGEEIYALRCTLEPLMEATWDPDIYMDARQTKEAFEAMIHTNPQDLQTL